ncbi:MAG TPA: hypothetical protein VFB62_15310 [Polyangiaceae bacterium]|nr:hypothetical protein [Polyangiaceae bacterium]
MSKSVSRKKRGNKARTTKRAAAAKRSGDDRGASAEAASERTQRDTWHRDLLLMRLEDLPSFEAARARQLSDVRKHLYELLCLLRLERIPDHCAPWRNLLYEVLSKAYAIARDQEGAGRDPFDYTVPRDLIAAWLARVALEHLVPPSLPFTQAKPDGVTLLQARALAAAAYGSPSMHSTTGFNRGTRKEISDFLKKKLGPERDPASARMRLNRSEELDALRLSAEKYLEKWRTGEDGWTKRSAMRSLCSRIAFVLPLRASPEVEARVADELTSDATITADVDDEGIVAERLVGTIFAKFGQPLPRGAWNYRDGRRMRAQA